MWNRKEEMKNDRLEKFSEIYDGDIRIAKIYGKDVRELNRNSRLIEKAPEMLATLKDITKFYMITLESAPTERLGMIDDLIRYIEGDIKCRI